MVGDLTSFKSKRQRTHSNKMQVNTTGCATLPGKGACKVIRSQLLITLAAKHVVGVVGAFY